MRKKNGLLLIFLAAILFVLAACGSSNDTKKKEKGKVDTSLFPVKIDNKEKSINGGTLKVALATDAPFKGMFSAELYQDGFDSQILGYMSNSLFTTKEDFLIDDDGLAKLTVNEDAKKATITIRENIKWSDGEAFTADDVIYPYYIIGDKDYTGIRYDTDFQNIVGAKEFHAGKAKEIAGIKKIDDHTVEITFKKISPAIYSGGDGLWGSAAPKHKLEKIAIKDLEKSDEIRKNPITLGAFVMSKLVKGESVELVANENFYKGKPKLDKVVIEVVPSASISAAIKAGKYDLTLPDYPASDYDAIKNLKNITILGRPELAYSYLGFKLGKWDSKKSEVIVNEKAKMNDKNLRQAIAYAMNIEEVSKVYYDGLRTRANSLIPPVFEAYYDAKLKGYSFDKKKAEELLDDAGYKDTDNDGIREDKDRKPFTIKLATKSESDKDEKIFQFFIQNWKDVGLKVELTTGRIIEFNSFYDKVQADDKEIDMFMAAWGTGTNPSPIGLYSKGASFNFSRFTSPELETMLENIDSVDALDPTYRAEAFKKWQEFMSDNAATVPMYFRTELAPVNKRVKNYNIDYLSKEGIEKVELTADEPIKDE